MIDLRKVPPDAAAEYKDYRGDTTWIKDLDLRAPDYPLAYVWSHTTKRWRTKREHICMDRVWPFTDSA